MNTERTGRLPGAIVTGSSRGIGAAIAKQLATAGHGVCVNYRQRHDLAKDVVRRIEEAGGRAFSLAGDVTNRADVDRLVAATVERYGGVQVVVNNAGASHHTALHDLTEEAWERALSVNLSAAFYTVQAARPFLEAQPWARVINISSLRANTGSAHGVHYAAGKSGLIGLTRSLALALAPRITANAVCPGFTRTDMTAATLAENENEIVGRIPAGRIGEPEEIALLVGYLASPAAAYITGQTISINGGLDMR